MNLKDYMAKVETIVLPPGSEKTGHESAWLDFCTFTLKGGKFLIVDVGFAPSVEDGLEVEAPSGEYKLEVKLVHYGEDVRFARLRATRRQSGLAQGWAALTGGSSKLGKQLGETWTDTARTSICDLAEFTAAWGKDDDASADKLQELLDVEENFGVVEFEGKSKASLAWVTSGFGDGSYPVFELVGKGGVVGFEIEFIAPGRPNPFGPREDEDEDGGPEASDNFSDALAQMMKALQEAKPGLQNASKEERKATVADIVQRMEAKAQGQFAEAAEELKQHLISVRQKAGKPRLEFAASTDESPFATPQVQSIVKVLEASGYERLGLATLAGVQAYVAGYFNRRTGAAAEIGVLPKELSLDLSVQFTDETYFRATDNATNSWLPIPPWATILRKPGATAAELLRCFEEGAPAKPRRMNPDEPLVDALTRAANRQMDWVNDRGGFTEAEFKAMALLKNPPLADNADWLEASRMESAEKALFKWLQIQPGLPFDPLSVIEDIAIIHDELNWQHVATLYGAASKDYGAKMRDFQDGTRREAFARINAERGNKLRRVAVKTTLLGADFYLPEAMGVTP